MASLVSQCADQEWTSNPSSTLQYSGVRSIGRFCGQIHWPPTWVGAAIVGRQRVNHVLARELTGPEAAAYLGLSVRQVRRLLERYRSDGAAGLVHGNHGRAPAHRIAEVATREVLEQDPQRRCPSARTRDQLDAAALPLSGHSGSHRLPGTAWRPAGPCRDRRRRRPDRRPPSGGGRSDERRPRS
ncbi:MAG: helix-turn-helix domain-containing protein [Chloroflexota bacterium]|nr:MAG: helix-turn-helix domain-containing protein [Chloroflexota bacterium]